MLTDVRIIGYRLVGINEINEINDINDINETAYFSRKSGKAPEKRHQEKAWEIAFPKGEGGTAKR